MSNDQWGNPVFSELPFAIAFGLCPSISGYPVSGRNQGYLGTTSTTGKPVRATTYTPQGTNAQRSFQSTSANDSISGTGAQILSITYLNTSFQLKTDTIWLSGSSPANSNQTDIAFIESMAVTQVGSGGGNAGTISIYTATAAGGSIWGSIAPGDNQTFWAHHYVPSGVTCYILQMSCGATIAPGQMNLNHSGNPLLSSLPQQQIGMTISHPGGGTWDHEFTIPLAVPGPDLVWIVERPTFATGSYSANGSTATAGFEWVQF